MAPRTTLIEPVQSLLTALTTPSQPLPSPNSSSPQPPKPLLTCFTTLPTPQVHEHGLPQLAPFLGRTFTGPDGVSRYFALLAEHLAIANMAFEPDDAWLVDDSCMAVSLRGTATFTWRATAQAWDEAFVYRIALARDTSDDPEKRGQLLVWEYRVWADSGAAYLARTGRLGELLAADGGKGGVEGIHVGGLEEDGKMQGRETRRSMDRKRSGCQDVLGGGLSVYGSCG
ncbi:uncharacterized protein N7459_000620 [Penicillium hispanicum]|uniref:uncharacterized protein n=1 Tax=Penicillium hispanicum TaxID=1080232 RepID=UPI00253FE5B1|nr:uncharacterized protein N7459_000620 [Penicillium hispanicum]KAJ5594412.1 hypothetical protein N7459_000620 [Penicillium hispanicum]